MVILSACGRGGGGAGLAPRQSSYIRNKVVSETRKDRRIFIGSSPQASSQFFVYCNEET